MKFSIIRNFLFGMFFISETQAQTSWGNGFSLSGQAAIHSDYIWRGLSQTWGKPAAQINLSAEHKSGIYMGFFASNVSSQFVPNGSLEMDFSGGYKIKQDDFTLDLGGIYSYYPGANFNKAPFFPPFTDSDPRTLELYTSASKGPFSARIGYIPTRFYGWNTNNSGINGVFNSEQPQAGLTGKSNGALNVEASYNHLFKPELSGQITLGRQIVPNSRDVNWNYGKLSATLSLDSGWAASAAFSFTSNPKAFKDYGSLANNGQRSTPSRSTVFFSISKEI